MLDMDFTVIRKKLLSLIFQCPLHLNLTLI